VRPFFHRRIIDRVARLSPAWLFGLLAPLIAVLGIVGSPLLWTPPGRLYIDGERNLSAAFSAGLLLLSAVFAASVALVAAPRSAARRSSAGLTLVFTYMALDEASGGMHEKLEGIAADSSIAHSWVVLMMPVIAMAGVLWLFLLRELTAGPPRWAFVCGAVAWTTATVMEYRYYGSNEVQIAWSMTVEEIAEMAGSAAFAFALLLELRHRTRRDALSTRGP
jgi:hypothetical protein